MYSKLLLFISIIIIIFILIITLYNKYNINTYDTFATPKSPKEINDHDGHMNFNFLSDILYPHHFLRIPSLGRELSALINSFSTIVNSSITSCTFAL